MKYIFNRFLYSHIMKLAHKFNWHYAPPIYPDGDTHLWCQWCGFRQTVKKRDWKYTTEIACLEQKISRATED